MSDASTNPTSQVWTSDNTDSTVPPVAVDHSAELRESETDDEALATDPRHQRRIEHMQALFAFSFGGADQVEDSQVSYVEEVMAETTTIDESIQSVAPERPLKDINKVDLAILRLIMFESNHKKTPKKVLLDEAVELAKQYGTDSSPGFVNAVLGKLILHN